MSATADEKLEAGDDDNHHQDKRRGIGDRHAVFAGVVVKFAAEDHLKMRHLKSLDVAVDAVKSNIGNVMLAAGVEAAADFDAQIFYRFVELQTLLA